jgi:hypothetical protein
MNRRAFITLFGSAAASGRSRRARSSRRCRSSASFATAREAGFGHLLAAFRKGLNEAGYVEGRNVAIEFRWANNDDEQLPALAKDLVSRQVAVIVANYGSVAAVMAATRSIPIVVSSGDDLVTTGIVANLNRPGGNVTGVTFFDIPRSGKRLGLLHELLPKDARIALLLDPKFVVQRELALHISCGNGEPGCERDELPAMPDEERTGGGLMSYGASQTDAYRRGSPPTCPVELPTRFEFVINLKTARTLGLSLTTGQGSPIWAGFETRRASVQALREAGAVIVGKTVSTEFALISWSATPSIFRGLVRVPWPV